jgi:uncharacterized protein (DUF1778 family)
MDRPKFRRPSEMPKGDKRVPLSARVKEETRDALAKAAKEQKLSIGLIVSNILDDYVDWLRTEIDKKR